ncbi:MAG: DNA-binding NtrC family response regulator [Paraglaciecola sp.]|jgi:DNA-binding NtrC family response regulator
MTKTTGAICTVEVIDYALLNISLNAHDAMPDVVMQGKLDGYKLATVAHKQQPSLKVLLTSGYVHKRDTTLPENNVYLSNLLAKPYRQLELAHAVHRTLNTDK